MSNEELVKLIQSGQSKYMSELWEQNKGYIGKLTLKYKGYAELEDLKQEAYFGICEAVKHFDTEKDVLFLTYATFWIEQALKRYIATFYNTIRLPEHAYNKVQQYKKIANEYKKYYGCEITDIEMSQYLGVSIEQVRTIKQNVKICNMQSLNAPMGEEELTLNDTLASDEELEEDIVKSVDTAAMKKALWEYVDTLPDIMPIVIEKRFKHKATLKEIGQALSVSIEQVRQKESKALRTLRTGNNNVIRTYYEQYIDVLPRHVGVNEFNRTWFSEVELAVLGW
ncbi:MAG: sigma-70 family RNA polymerase sigma factor [Lachnospiraceae bacterium]|nr:sigma-70 family RNA polymerase sigma factor [Lachnospiraceae bacterium]